MTFDEWQKNGPYNSVWLKKDNIGPIELIVLSAKHESGRSPEFVCVRKEYAALNPMDRDVNSVTLYGYELSLTPWPEEEIHIHGPIIDSVMKMVREEIATSLKAFEKTGKIPYETRNACYQLGFFHGRCIIEQNTATYESWNKSWVDGFIDGIIHDLRHRGKL